MNKKNVEILCNMLGDLIKVAIPIILDALISNDDTDETYISNDN